MVGHRLLLRVWRGHGAGGGCRYGATGVGRDHPGTLPRLWTCHPSPCPCSTSCPSAPARPPPRPSTPPGPWPSWPTAAG
ncbi:hypothetical protein [Ornithinimicrobium kibberense]|uniref:hypothetical protein n=1 Tax=Ornithinimicrobium kibberense TaxID=282060 RepID=UPI00360A6F11